MGVDESAFVSHYFRQLFRLCRLSPSWFFGAWLCSVFADTCQGCVHNQGVRVRIGIILREIEIHLMFAPTLLGAKHIVSNSVHLFLSRLLTFGYSPEMAGCYSLYYTIILQDDTLYGRDCVLFHSK